MLVFKNYLRLRYVFQFPDLRTRMFEFSYPGVKDFAQLAMDMSRNQLIVGARSVQPLHSFPTVYNLFSNQKFYFPETSSSG